MKARFKTSGFAVAPYTLMDADIDPKALIVYLWLHRFGWNSPRGCYASLATIAERSHISRKVVQRCIGRLVAGGWVDVEHRPGMTAVYHVAVDNPGQKRPKVKNDPGQKRPRGLVKNDLPTQVKNDLQTKTHEQEPITRTLVKLESEFPAAPVPPKRKPRAKGSEAFEKFWKLYLSAPVRAHSQSKPKALTQWQKTIRTETEADLVKALETEIAHQQAAGDEFISPLPDCFRWLRDERYATVEQRPTGQQAINHATYVF
jgi:hypothetical protein